MAETQILKDFFYPMGYNESLNASRDIEPLIFIIMTNPRLLPNNCIKFIQEKKRFICLIIHELLFYVSRSVLRL